MGWPVRDIGGVDKAGGTSGVKKMSQGEVEALTGELKAETTKLMDAYKAAPTPEAKRAVLHGQTIGQTIDQFVIDVIMNKSIELPNGMNPINVVAPAIKPLLEGGMTYSISIPWQLGGQEFNFSLKSMPGGQQHDGVHWSEMTLR